MRTSAARLVLAIILAAVGARSASAQTAEEIVEKSITALGGRAAHAKIKSRSMSGTITISTPVGEVQGTIETLNAAPNKQRTLVKADLASFGAGLLEVDQRFDGSTGYVLDTLQGNRDITGNQLDNMRNSAFRTRSSPTRSSGSRSRSRARRRLVTAMPMSSCSSRRPARPSASSSMPRRSCRSSSC
jgi:hypothetical protein